MVLGELQTYQLGIEVRGRWERGSSAVSPPPTAPTPVVPAVCLEKTPRWKIPGQGTSSLPGLQVFPRPQAGTLFPVSWGRISDLWERGAIEPTV